MLLGCIGDDFTGSSDLANVLAKGGMRSVLYSGVPAAPASADVEAGIVALKTRTVPADEAIERSLAAFGWLKAQGCEQFLFKYCSTFDSTPQGNIGPVADALADRLGASCVIVCPAFPSLNRTVFAGHLFVGDRLLSESGMEHHPLTPMTDPDLRRWLAHQSRYQVGHVHAGVVLDGRNAIRIALNRQHDDSVRLIVTDTVRDKDLIEIAGAAADLPLITGGSGVALGLPANFRARGAIGHSQIAWGGQKGPCVAISGSCSSATRAQVSHHCGSHAALEITADAVMEAQMKPDDAARWALSQPHDIPLVFSSTDPETVSAAQKRYGKAAVTGAIEDFLAETARILAAAGVTRIVSAGGETSGALVEALKIEAMEIGPEIDPGVPALKVTGRPLALALKAGNFGRTGFFSHAAAILEDDG